MGIVGADEAGKGPVLGSMFAAAVRIPDDAVLPNGVRDSKALKPERREELADALRNDDRVAIAVAEIPVARIDDPATDMNTLTVVGQAAALNQVIEPSDRCVVDASDVRPERFGIRVADRLEHPVDMTAQHRADEDHPVVAAASIVAKVERDTHVAELETEYGQVGNGYPSDPATRTFLEDFVADQGCLPECARATWATAGDVLAETEQVELADYR